MSVAWWRFYVKISADIETTKTRSLTYLEFSHTNSLLAGFSKSKFGNKYLQHFL